MLKRLITPLLAVAAFVGGGTLLGSALASSGPASGTSVARAAPKPVAKVTALSGKHLYAEHNGKVATLAKGDQVFLHDIVAVGPNTKATLKLQIPKGLGKNTDLLDLYKQLGKGKPKANAVVKQIGILLPYAKSHRTLKLKRSGKFIEARLSGN